MCMGTILLQVEFFQNTLRNFSLKWKFLFVFEGKIINILSQIFGFHARQMKFLLFLHIFTDKIFSFEILVAKS